MITLTASAAGRLGERATAHVEEHGVVTRRGTARVPETLEVSRAIIRTISRWYGAPRTTDRGEVAYWTIPASDIESEP